MPSLPISPGCRLRRLLLAVAVAAVLGPGARSAHGQVGSALLGAGGGMAAGLYTTTAIYVVKARFGSYIYSVDDLVALTPEMLPVVALPAAGTWLGLESGKGLEQAAIWGGVGFLGGAGLGVGAGHLIWRTREGRWAGAVIGGALGMLTGAVVGARRGLREDEDSSGTMSFAVTVPLGRF